MSKADELEARLHESEEQVESAWKELQALRRACKANGHDWGPTIVGRYAYEGGGGRTAYDVSWQRKCAGCGQQMFVQSGQRRTTTLAELRAKYGDDDEAMIVVLEPMWY